MPISARLSMPLALRPSSSSRNGDGRSSRRLSLRLPSRRGRRRSPPPSADASTTKLARTTASTSSSSHSRSPPLEARGDGDEEEEEKFAMPNEEVDSVDQVEALPDAQKKQVVREGESIEEEDEKIAVPNEEVDSVDQVEVLPDAQKKQVVQEGESIEEEDEKITVPNEEVDSVRRVEVPPVARQQQVVRAEVSIDAASTVEAPLATISVARKGTPETVSASVSDDDELPQEESSLGSLSSGKRSGTSEDVEDVTPHDVSGLGAVLGKIRSEDLVVSPEEMANDSEDVEDVTPGDVADHDEISMDEREDDEEDDDEEEEEEEEEEEDEKNAALEEEAFAVISKAEAPPVARKESVVPAEELIDVASKPDSPAEAPPVIAATVREATPKNAIASVSDGDEVPQEESSLCSLSNEERLESSEEIIVTPEASSNTARGQICSEDLVAGPEEKANTGEELVRKALAAVGKSAAAAAMRRVIANLRLSGVRSSPMATYSFETASYLGKCVKPTAARWMGLCALFTPVCPLFCSNWERDVVKRWRRI